MKDSVEANAPEAVETESPPKATPRSARPSAIQNVATSKEPSESSELKEVLAWLRGFEPKRVRMEAAREIVRARVAEKTAREDLDEAKALVTSLLGLLPRYYFSMRSDLLALPVKRSDATGPRGTRIHVSYGSKSPVETHAELYEQSWGKKLLSGYDHPDELTEAEAEAWIERGWNGIEGRVLSGADFLLARLDGVLELDGRVTIRAADDTLIDATYWALVDLEQDWVDPGMRTPKPTELPKEKGPQEAFASPGYLKFIAGELGGDLRVNLCLRFETNTGPWASSAEAQDTTWTKKYRKKHERNVWKYRDLVRQQFYGKGKIFFEKRPEGLSTPKTIQIDVVSPAELWRLP